MIKKILFPCILFLLLAAAAGPEVVSAGVDPLASPTPRPTERITAPMISGVNPDAVLSEGNLGDSLPSDSFVPAGISIPAPLGPAFFVQPKAQSGGGDITITNLSRNLDDINCGPAALAHAFNLLDPEGINLAQTTSQLSEFMSTRGLMYDWGTGIEELAFTARKFGYEGSISFQNWSFGQLVELLHTGRPVVVSLGVNGADKPGHFVTLSGLSDDGNWITFQNPDRGEMILSRDEFQSLWQLQGNAGMIPQKKISINAADPMLPWMGLFGVVSSLALTMNQSAGWRESRAFSQLRKQLANPRRKGIGGEILQPKEPEVIRIPRYETKTVYRGIKTVEVEVPVYETRKVKVGVREIRKEVPQYETRRVKVGVENVSRKVPIYSIKKIKTGTKLVRKEIPVTRYKIKIEKVWKKYIQRVPVYRTIGAKRFIVGYKNQVRWKRVPVTKKVPYRTTKTISIEVPIYTEKKVVSGYKTVTEKVPKYEQKKILVGHKVIQDTVPAFEERQVQVGTKTVPREMPQYETVRVVAGYDEVPAGSKISLDGVDLKIKNICEEDNRLKELLVDRDFEVSEVVYLKGGPGAGFGMEKIENSYSGFSAGGGGGSTPWMLLFKLVSRALVFLRDGTDILERFGAKPDSQAIIMYYGSGKNKMIDEIIVINRGNENLTVDSINIGSSDVNSPHEKDIVEIYPISSSGRDQFKGKSVGSGSFQSISVNPHFCILTNTQNIIYIKLSTKSNRSGFLIHEILHGN